MLQGALIHAARGALLVLALVAIAAGTEAAAHGAEIDRDLLNRFRREYPAAVDRLRGFYSTLRIEMQNTWPEPISGSTPESRVLRYAARGDLLRLDTVATIADKSQESVSVANPRASFRLTPSRSGGGYTVDTIDGYAERLLTLRIGAVALFAPFGFYEFAMDELVYQPGFEWTGFGFDGNGSSGLVKGEFRAISAEESLLSGWFLFAPDQHWALRGWYLRAQLKDREQGPGHRECKITYDERLHPSGFPLLKRAEYTTVFDPMANRRMVELYEVTKIEQVDVPESEFTLPAFGLPDVVAPSDPQRRFLWILVAVAIVLLVLFTVAWNRRRKQRAIQA